MNLLSLASHLMSSTSSDAAQVDCCAGARGRFFPGRAFHFPHFISLLAKLQSENDWVKRKEWELVKDGQILEGEFQGVWTVDLCGLARKDGYALMMWQSEKEILPLNYDTGR